MYSSIGEFFVALKDGRFDFHELYRVTVEQYTTFTKTPDMVNFWHWLLDTLGAFFAAVPFILVILSLVVAFFGQKLMPILKFLAFFYLGFISGTLYLGPVISQIVAVPHWISGLVIGILAAVLYRFIYLAAYGIAGLYCAYTLAYTLIFAREGAEPTATKAVTCLVIAVALVVVSYIFMKYCEMIGTAILGGYLVSFIIRCNFWDFRSLDVIASVPWVGAVLITAVIAIPAAIVQIKMRTRY